MISIHIDQSTMACGVAIMEGGEPLWHGVAKSKKKTAPGRLFEMLLDLKDLVDKYQPEEMTIERVLFAMTDRDGRLKMSLDAIAGMVGATLICKMIAAYKGIPCYEISPATIKLAATQDGRADKWKVIRCVAAAMGIDEYQILDDNHADALAAGLAWSNPDFKTTMIEKIKEQQNKKRRRKK